MKTFTIIACVALLTLPRVVRAQEGIDAARDLYASASYEEALTLLSRLETPGSRPQERLAVNQYRAFCLLALGRTVEAEAAIEAVVSADLLYHPGDADASPRLRSTFSGVRQRILPTIVVQEYGRAKAAFDRQDYPAAIADFDRVLQALGDPDLRGAADRAPLSDLRTLATGFRDLSVKATAPPPPPAAPPAEVAAAPAVPALKPIYDAAESGVVAPVILRQTLPPFPREIVAYGAGILEVIISEGGNVESASMRASINPRYDVLVLNATKAWRYEPATVSGRPVKYRKLINISLKPGS